MPNDVKLSADDKEADDATGDDDVTIDFPGDENDEVNTETLIEQLGFKDLNVGKNFIFKYCCKICGPINGLCLVANTAVHWY